MAKLKNALSLFDGMSCGQIALKKLGIKIGNYYASEIDKYAMQITKKNFPETKFIGDVRSVKGKDYKDIDLLLGGSPCQGFSLAGKQLNFEDPRSKLFFEYVRILKEVKPKYFLLENVKMKKEYQDIITEYLGVEPIKINSSLLSAQNRERLYWTNIPNIEPPEEKGLVIADILNIKIKEEEKENRIIMTKENFKIKVRKNYIDKKEMAEYLRKQKIKNCITIKELSKKIKISKTKIEHWFRLDNSFSIPDPNNYFKLKEILKLDDRYDKAVTEFEKKNNKYDMAKRIYHIKGKHPTLTTLTGGGQRKTITDGKDKFYLTPVHCERLQTIPDDYTKGVSNTQRYKMLGNGWTVDVICHILKNIKE